MHNTLPVSAIARGLKWFGIYGTCLAMMLALLGCGKENPENTNGDTAEVPGPASSNVDHSSPSAVAESWKKAISKNDWTSAMASMTRESQGLFARSVAMVTSQVVIGDKAKTAALDEIFSKHGIGKDKPEDVFNNLKDKGALIADLLEFEKKNPRPLASGFKGFGSLMQRVMEAEYTDFRIDGDTATAQVIAPDKTVGMADFRKIDGKWCQDFIASDQRKKAAPRKTNGE